MLHENTTMPPASSRSSATSTADSADSADPVETAADLVEPTHSSPSAPLFSPLYQQIKSLLLSDLRAGLWRPGEAIPSELEFAARFRVSQGTVRKAIDELAADNLLTRRQGKGTFVTTHAEQQIEYRFLKLVPDTGDPSTEGPAERHIISCQRLPADAAVARALCLAAGDTVLQARRVLSFSHVPTILEDVWLPAEPFAGLTTARLADYQGSMYALFEAEFGVRMVRAEENIRAVVADARQARLLQVAPGTPLLSVERVAHTFHDAPMELRRGWYRTDTHHYHNELG